MLLVLFLLALAMSGAAFGLLFVMVFGARR